MTFLICSKELASIPAAQWDRLVGANDPFLTHAFLIGLEQTHCIGGATGWQPRHVVCYQDGRLVGAVPVYEKQHSYGEFIFDFDWAKAAESAGIAYYPKLISAVPFTPVSGPRFLVAPDADQSAVRSRLIEHLGQACMAEGNSSVHVLFTTQTERDALVDAGYIARLGFQFHWIRQPGWQTFDDYLGAFRASARKQVRKERAQAQAHGLDIHILTGAEVLPNQREAFWRCYKSTIDKHYSHAYLNRAFVDHLFDHMSQQVLLAVASRAQTVVACALFLHRGQHLYGRYWGSLEPLEGLHFELCYYQPIDWALRHGIERFEAGAQGLHKLKRGLLARACHSAHLIEHPALARAVGAHLQRERAVVQQQIDHLNQHSPYRRED